MLLLSMVMQIWSRNIAMAGTNSRNGYDAFHIVAKQGNLEVWKVLMDAILELSMVCDSLNTTALHTAASLGHIEVVNFLLEKGSSVSVVTIAKSSAKSALHSAARYGHVEIGKSLLSTELGITTRNCHPTFSLFF
ncbi:hypothetical protein Ddye_018983 [Dipteronia dyeriana]|uniref:Ankyrin repeat protein n=1 Tax=Dipteronia dyeriana TaxID=168575 RepID=A0AAD9WV83_9ROSI|nr:hypothetical protein Ddye_018983 [Dipteronia dyeriana]